MLPHNFSWEGHVLVVSPTGTTRICSAKLTTSCSEIRLLDEKLRELIVERIQEMLSKLCKPNKATILKSTRIELDEIFVKNIIPQTPDILIIEKLKANE